MQWIVRSGKDALTATLEKRLWTCTDQFCANSGLESQECPSPALGLIFLRFAEVVALPVELIARFAKLTLPMLRQKQALPELNRNLGRTRDLMLVFRIFRDAVRNLPGWEVKTEIWPGQFSSSCFLGLGLLLLALTSAHATIGVQYQMLLGNPSTATADTNDHSHYLIQRDVEALDYNDTLRQPNWASWHYTTSDSGSSGRSSFFFLDTNLPANFYWVQTNDYSGSGYDRGHMCPSGDRTVSTAVNDQTFFMSNIIPQAPDNNQGIWANLESFSRSLASGGNEVLVTCGPEGFGTNRTASTGQIPIASNVWKIIIVVPAGGGSTLDRITSTSRVIAVNIPNIQGIRTAPWQNYLTSVNQLQTNTGFTFFTTLNSNLAVVLRARVDGAPAAGITGFTPDMGERNTSVVISGINFSGTTAVEFNGQSTTFTVNSGTQITATVPNGATTGPISVIAAGGLATSASTFTVNSPVITQPTLNIGLLGSDVVLSWSVTATNFALQQNPDLSSTNWTAYTGAVNDDGTNRTATVSTPTGNLFFRLYSQ